MLKASRIYVILYEATSLLSGPTSGILISCFTAKIMAKSSLEQKQLDAMWSASARVKSSGWQTIFFHSFSCNGRTLASHAALNISAIIELSVLQATSNNYFNQEKAGSTTPRTGCSTDARKQHSEAIFTLHTCFSMGTLWTICCFRRFFTLPAFLLLTWLRSQKTTVVNMMDIIYEFPDAGEALNIKPFS